MKSNQALSKKLLLYLLEINNISFKYYLTVYLVFFIAANPGENFLIRGYPLNPKYVFWLVLISGILKLFYQKESVINFLIKTINYFRQKNIKSRFLRSLINLLPKNRDEILELSTKSTKSFFHISLIAFFASSLILNLLKKFFSDFYEKLPKINFTVFFIITMITGFISSRKQKDKNQTIIEPQN